MADPGVAPNKVHAWFGPRLDLVGKLGVNMIRSKRNMFNWRIFCNIPAISRNNEASITWELKQETWIDEGVHLMRDVRLFAKIHSPLTHHSLIEDWVKIKFDHKSRKVTVAHRTNVINPK